MARKRKNIPVKEFVNMGNQILRDCRENADFRKGVFLVMEEVLMQTGQYQGFRYLTEKEVPEGEDPGVKTVDGEMKFCDGTRRAYFGGGE